MEPVSSAQLSQMWELRSRTLLDFFCQVPDVGVEVADVVGLFLPDPEDLVHRRLEVGLAQGDDGELLRKVVAVDHAEFLDGVRGRAVRPAGTDGESGVPHAVVYDVAAGRDEDLVCFAHDVFLCCRVPRSAAAHAGSELYLMTSLELTSRAVSRSILTMRRS